MPKTDGAARSPRRRRRSPAPRKKRPRSIESSRRSPAPSPREDRAAIARQIERFIAAYEARDLDSLLTTYSKDLVKLRQGVGDERKAETARRLRAVFADYDGRVEVDNVETFVSGDLAVTRGTFLVTLTRKAGGEPTRAFRRRYLEVWRREEGDWRVFRTMDNAAE